VAIDFRLTARQRELQLQSRKFAREVLARALEAETLPTPEERFAATRTAAHHGFELREDREHRERDSLRAQARAFEACGELAARECLSIERALEDVRRACAQWAVQPELATVVRDRPMHAWRGQLQHPANV